MILNIAQALSLRGQPDSYEQQEAIWLLGHILNLSALQLKLAPHHHLDAEQEQRYFSGLMRLTKGEPLAYILGSQPFWTLDLTVTSDTLVPRPDTEILIETVLALDLPQQTTMVDLGTGTGAIALALASERPHWSIIATDIEPATLEVAKANAQKHHFTQVQFAVGAWYQALQPQKFDLIVSNPPYIAADDVHVASLQYEPQRALVAEKQGMADLETIIAGAKEWLKPQGWMAVEHGFDQANAVRTLFRQYGFEQIRSVQDYGGNDRVTFGQLN